MSFPPPLVSTGVDLNGLVALWDFERTTATDGATFAAFPDPSVVATLETSDSRDVIVAGKIGTAVDLDGFDDQLVAPDMPAFDLAASHSLTAWIVLDQILDIDYGVVGKPDAYTMEIESDTRCIDYSIFDPADALHEVAPTQCALSLGQWHHVAAVFDGVELVVYHDGIEIGQTPYAASVRLNNAPVLIGNNTYAPGRYFDGRIDDVTIWSRALTSTEVQMIEQTQR